MQAHQTDHTTYLVPSSPLPDNYRTSKHKLLSPCIEQKRNRCKASKKKEITVMIEADPGGKGRKCLFNFWGWRFYCHLSGGTTCDPTRMHRTTNTDAHAVLRSLRRTNQDFRVGTFPLLMARLNTEIKGLECVQESVDYQILQWRKNLINASTEQVQALFDLHSCINANAFPAKFRNRDIFTDRERVCAFLNDKHYPMNIHYKGLWDHNELRSKYSTTYKTILPTRHNALST